jgi:hypothetical protein
LILLQSVMYKGKGEGYEEVKDREERMEGRRTTTRKREEVL